MDIMINIALIIIGVLLFCSVVIVHEFGHFSMAKLFGIKVHEFSVGMGPKLFQRKSGDTTYSIRALPIGGFCAMEGEDEDSESPDSFGSKKVWQRILVIAMGGIFNILLGFIFMIILLIPQQVYATTTIAQFSDNATTQETGLQIGDTITAFDGYSVNCDRDLSFAMSMSNGIKEALDGTDEYCYADIEVNRQGETVNLEDVQFTIAEENESRYMKIDFKVEGEDQNLFTLISQAFKYTVSTARMVWTSLIGLIVGKFSINDMAGPVGTASVISQSAAAGLAVGFAEAVGNILYVMVILTVNLGIFNLLPIPALDGGRLVFLIIEGITRKPIPAKYERLVHTSGFVLLILFMLFVTYNDIVRLITGSGAIK